VAGMRAVDEVEALSQETADRFGPLPEALANLLALVRLRIVGAAAGIGSIRVDGDEVLITSEGRPFGERVLPRLPSGVRLGRNQVRVNRAALGKDWLAAIEALVTLVAGQRAAVPA
jgi:transcription-repair coupling factor (superfamily II helicase)